MESVQKGQTPQATNLLMVESSSASLNVPRSESRIEMTGERPQRAYLWLGNFTDFDGEDPKMQRAGLEEVCQRMGWRIVRVCQVEESTPGKTFRDQFQSMLEDARDGKFDVLVVWSLEQLATGRKWSISHIITGLQDWGVRLYTCSEPFLDIDGPFAGLLEPLLDWVAQQEKIREESR